VRSFAPRSSSTACKLGIRFIFTVSVLFVFVVYSTKVSICLLSDDVGRLYDHCPCSGWLKSANVGFNL
jgi:hypothetical protein